MIYLLCSSKILAEVMDQWVKCLLCNNFSVPLLGGEQRRELPETCWPAGLTYPPGDGRDPV